MRKALFIGGLLASLLSGQQKQHTFTVVPDSTRANVGTLGFQDISNPPKQITFQAPPILPGDAHYIWPTVDGTPGSCLSTDGSFTLSFQNCASGGSGIFVSSSAFFFTDTEGGGVVTGDLSAGTAQTITFTNCPAGVNGSDTNHPLFLTDGSTSEAVNINGGTCVAGAPGTLTFNTVHNYSPGWTISSAANPCGLHEAVQYVTTMGGGSIFVGAGTCNSQATVIVNTRAYIAGAAEELTFFVNQSTTADAIDFNLAGVTGAVTRAAGLSNMTVAGGGANSTQADFNSGTAITVIEANQAFYLSQLSIRNHYYGIRKVSSYSIYILNVQVYYTAIDAIRIQDQSLPFGGADTYINNFTASDEGATGSLNGLRAGIRVTSCSGLYVTNSAVTVKGIGLYVTPGVISGENVASFGFIGSNVLFDTNEQAGILLDGSAGSAYLTSWNLDSNTWSAFSGYDLGSSTFITPAPGIRLIGPNLQDVNIATRVRENGGNGIEIYGGTQITVQSREITNNGQAAGSPTYAGVAVSANASYWSVINSQIGNFASSLTSMQYLGVLVFGGTTDNYRISGNDFVANTNAPIDNLATGTHAIVEGNSPNDFTANLSFTDSSSNVNANGFIGTATSGNLISDTNGNFYVDNGGYIYTKDTLEIDGGASITEAQPTYIESYQPGNGVTWAFNSNGNYGVMKLGNSTNTGGFDSQGAQVLCTAINGECQAIIFEAVDSGTTTTIGTSATNLGITIQPTGGGDELFAGVNSIFSFKNGTASDYIWSLGADGSHKGVFGLSDASGGGGYAGSGEQIYATAASGIVEALNGFVAGISTSGNQTVYGPSNAISYNGPAGGNKTWALNSPAANGQLILYNNSGTNTVDLEGGTGSTFAASVEALVFNGSSTSGNTFSNSNGNFIVDYAGDVYLQGALEINPAGPAIHVFAAPGSSYIEAITATPTLIWQLGQDGSNNGTFRIANSSGTATISGLGATGQLSATGMTAATVTGTTSVSAPSFIASGLVGLTGTCTIAGAAVLTITDGIITSKSGC